MPSPHTTEDEEPGFFKSRSVLLALGGLLLAGGGYLYSMPTPARAPAKKADKPVVVQVEITQPTPPPPQTVKPKDVPEEKPDPFIPQPDVKPSAKKDSKPEEKPADETLGTAIGGGSGSLGMGTNGLGGSGESRIGGSGDGGGSQWGWYAGQVQNRLADALRSHPLTRRSMFSSTVKIWSDSTGRITRVKLGSSTGDSKVDAAIESDVFSGLVLNAPPPDGMPMPINLRLTVKQ